MRVLFHENVGGRIYSAITGAHVATVEVVNLTAEDSVRIMATVLNALEAEFAKTDQSEKSG